MNLYDDNGHRKYLNPAKRKAFLKAADDAERKVRTFCHTLCYIGCRISEALALTADRVDLKDSTVIIETLKKRRDHGRSVYLWSFARSTAWPHACAVMDAAKIKGPRATPKGLRHGYGVKAIITGIPLNLPQQLLRPAQLSTTAIYAYGMGPSKRQLVERMWG